MKSILPLFYVLLLIFPLLSQGQTIRYVKLSGTQAASTATSWTNSTSDLQGAINASASGDQVWVAAGTYKPTTSTTNRSARFSMKNGVAIYGGFAGTETSLNQRPVVNPVSGQPSSTTLSGDIDNDGTLTGNTYTLIYNDLYLNGTALLNGFVIAGANNQTSFGGAMYNYYSGTPTVTNCTFLNNYALQGAGMHNLGSSPMLTNCSFLDNSAYDGGGAMYNNNSSPSVTNCTFQRNTATRGGAVFIFTSINLLLTNCTFQRNTATQEGGAINSENSTNSTLINCAFLNNQATNYGGAINNYGGTLRAINSSLQNNTASLGAGIFTGSGMSILTNSVAFGNGGSKTFFYTGNTGITVSYSLFEPGVTGYTNAGNNLTTTTSPFTSTATVALHGCSLAINAGNNAAYTSASGPSTDLNGQLRTYNNGTIDMGAIEYQTTPTISLSIPTVNIAPIDSLFSQPFTASGGTAPHSFSLIRGSLPAGLTLSSTGVLSGTPTQVGSYSMTVRVTDATGCIALSSVYSLTTYSPIRYVKSGASGNGNSWAEASGDLQGQINITNARQVWVSAGTYKPTGDPYYRGGSISMKNGVAIYGGFVGTETSLSQRPTINPVSGQPSSTTLSGDIDNDGTQTGNSFQIINNNGLNATAILNGFVITGGNGGSNDYGGGINNVGSSPTLTNLSFQNNFAGRGGALYNKENSNPTVTNCVFQANSASQEGGAIDNQDGTVTLINCAFLNNQSTGTGGAIQNFRSVLRVINCTFQNNTASLGGAIHTFNGGATLTNCVAFGNGGSNTFTREVNDGTPSEFTATYSLFEPSSVTVIGMNVSGPGNLTTLSSPFASTATVAINACALAINSGSNDAYTSASGPATDLSGQNRYYNNGTIDIGAVEYQGAPNLQLVFTAQPVANSAVCVGANVTASISVSGTGPFTYQWYKDSFSTPVSSQTAATLSLNNVQTSDEGSYSVVVTGACNSVTSTAFSLTVNSAPVASLSASGPLTCDTPTVVLTASGGSTYQFSTGTTHSGPGSHTATVSQAGVYSVTVVSSAGCSAIASTTVTVDQTPPSVVILLSSATLSCANPMVSLSAVGGSTYQWSTGATTSSISATLAGTYSVTLTGANGCSSSATITISQDTNPPVFSINPSTGTPAGATLTCATPVVSLTAVGTGTYRWSTGATTSAVSVSVAGTYSVTLTGANGCSSMASIGVAADRTPPSISINPTGTTLSCTTTSVNLSAVGVGTYRWSTGATTSTISATSVGTYSVTLTGSNGCSAMASASVTYQNCVPTVANVIPPLSVTAGQAFSYTILATTFTDAETPNNLSLSMVGLPAGLSFVAPVTITGTASASVSTFYSVTVIATDPAGGSVATILTLIVVNPGSCGSMFTLKAGNWNEASVWSCGRIPLITDAITLHHGVSLPPTYQGQALRVMYSATGRLLFGTSSRLRLGGN
ncbi:hypothetical protein GCM10028807_29560 [Spirosoma daeguense]